MSASRDVIAKSIIDEALELQGRARADLINQRCAGEVRLRERVEALLAAIEVDDQFLSAPSAARVSGAPFAEEAPGDRIGPYELMERIGQGGFGLVFLAAQSAPLERKVALKVIKPGMDSRQVLSRFAAEQQTLALMDHPNIARVFDAGLTPRGRPFLVMELVRGESVTGFCDRVQLAVRERLSLFLEICRAIQHAHQKGVIHRDLKPTNVLVSTAGGGTAVKVIDFGIAKALGGPFDGQSSLTEAHQFVGTPEYMSPEQAHHPAGNVDTRSDVYSLGVILYELLAGTTPFSADRFRSGGLAEWQRVLKEERLPRPSQRCGSTASSGAARMNIATGRERTPADIARERRTDPPQLRHALRGDLDCIVMKCLEHDPERRYQTVDALAEDIGRYLLNLPILASPPSAAYRLRKFVRRHRVGVFAGLLVVSGLAGGLATALYGLSVAREERDTARAAQDGEKRQRLSAQRVSGFLEAMLAGAAPEVAAGKDTALLREFLRDAVQRLDRGELRDSPEAEVDLRITLSNTYRSIGDGATALRLLAPFSGRFTLIIQASDPLREKFLDAQAMALSSQLRFDEANAGLRQLAALRRSLYGDHDRRVALALTAIASNLTSQGAPKDSVDISNEALDIASQSGDDATLANVLTNLAEPLGMLGDLERAVSAAEEALKHCRKAYPGDHPNVAETLNNLAATLANANGRAERVIELLRESVEMKRRLYPEGHPHLGVGLHNLARALQDHGEFDAADRCYRDALASLRTFESQFGSDLAATLLNYAGLAGKRQQHELRETLGRDALERCERLYPDGHVNTAIALLNIAASLRDRGRNDAALDFFLRAAELQRRILPPDHPMRANALSAAGNALVDVDRADEAIAPLREALDIRRGIGDPTLISASLADLATALLQMKPPDSNPAEPAFKSSAAEAESLATECLDIRRRLLAPGDWRIVNTEGLRIAAQVEVLALDTSAGRTERVARIQAAESALLEEYDLLEAGSRDFDATRPSKLLATAARRLVRLYETHLAINPSGDLERSLKEWRSRVTTAPPNEQAK